MRKELIELLARFNENRIDARELRASVYEMFKANVEKSLSRKEATTLNNFFSWYLDMYNLELLPRPGFIGRIRDRFAQLFHGEYRVREAALRAKAEELRKLLESTVATEK